MQFLYIIIYLINLHVSGGLSEEVDEKILHAAFIPFGDLIDINIPLDYESGKILKNYHTNVCSSSWSYHFMS